MEMVRVCYGVQEKVGSPESLTSSLKLTQPKLEQERQFCGEHALLYLVTTYSALLILCSSNVINHVLVKKRSTEYAAFFFFNTHNPESLKAETAIRSIIRQLIDSMDAIQAVEDQLQKLNRASFVEFDSWVGLLSHVIQLNTAVFIMIDGIDECDATERRALISSLSSLTTDTQRLKIFLSSRYSVHMDLECKFTSMGHISMNCDGVVSDIRAYVDVSIQERVETGELVCGARQLLDEIILILTEHADGM